MKLAKTIKTVLIIAACILFIFGYGKAETAGETRAHNGEKIKIELIEATPVLVENDYGRQVYRINMDFKITNNTKTDLDQVDVTTLVKDKSGKLIMEFTSTFGYRGANGSEIKKGENVTLETYLEEGSLDSNAGFTAFYESDFSELEITHEVTRAYFSDNYTYTPSDE